MAEERLQKIMARAGLGSRRACEEFILEGRVEVDGRVVTELGSKADPDVQEIVVDGEVLRAESHVYYLLYKPRGFICSLRAERGKPRAIDLVRDQRRLYTVGRLDEDSEGLIIVTNDGELTQKLTHPRFSVAKEYRVTVDGDLDRDCLRKLRSGVYLAEGRTAGCEVEVLHKGRKSELLVRITEGLNRQVRRMLAAVGLNVRKLVRVRIGSIKLEGMRPAKVRRLTETEVAGLLSATSGGKSARGRGGARKSRPAASRAPVPRMSNREKKEARAKRRKAEARKAPGKGRQRSGKKTLARKAAKKAQGKTGRKKSTKTSRKPVRRGSSKKTGRG